MTNYDHMNKILINNSKSSAIMRDILLEHA